MKKEQLGAFIAERRKEARMTQKDLAERLHITDKAVSKWERGLSYPDVTLLEPLAEALGLGVEELMACRRQKTEKGEEPVNALLDISRDHLKKERHRSRSRLIGVAVVFLVTVVVICHSAFTGTERRVDSVVLKENVDGVNYLYVEEGGRLLKLRCGGEVDFDGIVTENQRWDQPNYLLDCRWNRRTCRGEVTGCQAAGGSSVDEGAIVGSVFGLEYHAGTQDTLFGCLDVSCEIVNCAAAPYGQGELYTYTFWEDDGGLTWTPRRQLLTIRDCLGFTLADWDHDGETELIVRTRWHEKPYTVYDRVDGEVRETWPDTVDPYLAERLRTPRERQADLK